MTHRNNNEREFEAFLAGEESGLARLYRRLPQSEPDARLDAAVLAMARAAVEPQRLNALRHAKDRHRRPLWLVGLSSAAGIVLAAGLAWQMRGAFRDSLPSPADSAAPAVRADREVIPISAIVPPPEPAPEEAAATATPAPSRAVVPTEVPAPAAAPPAPLTEVAKSAPRTARTTPHKREVEIAAAGAEKKDLPPRPEAEPTPETAAAAPARDALAATTAEAGSTEAQSNAGTAGSVPAGTIDQRAQPFPASATPDYNSVERKAAIASGTRRDDYGLDADAGSADPLVRQEERTRLARGSAKEKPRIAGGVAAEPAPPTAAQVAAPRPAVGATTAAPAAADQSAATGLQRNARLAPDDWVKAIRELLRVERKAEAIENLELFRRLHPDYTLPEDLRALRP